VLQQLENWQWGLITLHKWVLGDRDRHRFQPKIGQGSMETRQARSTNGESAF